MALFGGAENLERFACPDIPRGMIGVFVARCFRRSRFSRRFAI